MKSRTNFAIILCGLIMILATGLVGCNFYDPVDSPSGDAQNLSAARACFDAGNYTCATKYYSKLSSSSGDTEYEDMGFEQLSKDGITVYKFMTLVTDGGINAGKLITQFANQLSYNASSATRLDLFHAYQNALKIQNQQAQGVMRFVTGLALISEVLAEDAGTKGKLQASDLVQSPTECLASGSNPLKLFAGCNAPSGKSIISGNKISLLSTASDSDFTGNPTLYMINVGINDIQIALNMMGTASTLGSSASTFTTSVSGQTTLNPLDTKTDSPAFRYILVNLGVGGSS